MKRVISIVLLVCIALTCFSIQAFADTDYSAYAQQVTVKKGDSVVSLCKKLGLDYSADKTAILILNGFSREISLETLAIGQNLLLPKSDEDALAIVSLHDQNCPANAIEYKVKKGDTMFKICQAQHLNYNYYKETIKMLNGWETDDELSSIEARQIIYIPLDAPLLPVSTTVEPPIEGDRLEYYIVEHKLESGETAETVCEALGAPYSFEIDALVKSLNDVMNLKSLSAGKAYLFPSAKADNAVYAVYSHDIVAGDTTGKLCKAYGINYATVENLLESINPDLKLDSIPKGGRIYLISKVSAPVKVAAPVATPASQQQVTEEPESYTGIYVERSAGKAVIEVKVTHELKKVTVHWPNGAEETDEWNFSGTFTQAGILTYEDCTKTSIRFNADGTETRTTYYENGSGYLYIANKIAIWHDNQEEIANDCSFAKS